MATPLEPATTPFDFDNHRKTPFQVNQAKATTSKRNFVGRKSMSDGQLSKSKEVRTRVAELVADPAKVSLHSKPAPLPSRGQLADQIFQDRYGNSGKGSRNLGRKAQIVREYGLDTLSDEDYSIFAANYLAEVRRRDQSDGFSSPDLTSGTAANLTASKIVRSPRGHASLSQSRGEVDFSNDNQNPFEDLVQTLRLDQHVTKASDPLPGPSIQITPSPALSDRGSEPNFAQPPLEAASSNP